ncbi:hypothetical protein [Nonomuraea candida]|uniref:hypothetical protein n=1 Tax=Nonomuraea candida TaxID=359159 RepID=UPI0005BB81EF|nr:hypothetical protein [Nonomuraea candida]
MSKTAGVVRGSRLWRGGGIAAIVVLAISLAAGLVWFFADPLNVPADVLETLDRQASVVAMFTGMALGVAGLVAAMVALRASARDGRTGPAATPSDAGQSLRSSAVKPRSLAYDHTPASRRSRPPHRDLSALRTHVPPFLRQVLMAEHQNILAGRPPQRLCSLHHGCGLALIGTPNRAPRPETPQQLRERP